MNKEIKIKYPTPEFVVNQVLGANKKTWEASTKDKASLRLTLGYFVWLSKDEQDAFIRRWFHVVDSRKNFGWMGLFELLGRIADKWLDVLKHDEITKRNNGRHRKPAPDKIPKMTRYNCDYCGSQFKSVTQPLMCPMCNSPKVARV